MAVSFSMSTPSPSGRSALILIPALLASLSMLGPFSIDTPLPAFKEMAGALSVTSAEMQYVISAYMLAFALMSPFHGPISDALGRKPVMITGVALYVLACLGCVLSTSMEMLLFFRVCQGLSAGGGVIVSRTVIRDLYDGADAQRLMSRVMLIFSVAPAIAPIIGGWLLTVGDWRVIFGFMAAYAAIVALVITVALPESHPPEARLPFAVRPIVGSLIHVSRNAAFHRVSWAGAFTFAGQFVYVSGASIFLVDLLGKGEQDFWLLFVPMIGGLVLGSWFAGRTAGRIPGRSLVTACLCVSLAGAVIAVILGVLPTAETWPSAVVGPTLIAVGTGASYPITQLILLDMFPAERGAAVSMFTFLTLLTNGLIASLVIPHVTDSVLHLAITSLVMVVLGFAAWCWHLATSVEPVPITPDLEAHEPRVG